MFFNRWIIFYINRWNVFLWKTIMRIYNILPIIRCVPSAQIPTFQQRMYQIRTICVF